MTNVAPRDPNKLVEPLVHEIEQRLVQLCEGDAYLRDVLRKRLISKLNANERRAAARRRALNAKKFVEQRGKCAICGLRLGGPSIARKGREILPPDWPLLCLLCRKDTPPVSESG
jgi:hypothetical protein